MNSHGSQLCKQLVKARGFFSSFFSSHPSSWRSFALDIPSASTRAETVATFLLAYATFRRRMPLWGKTKGDQIVTSILVSQGWWPCVPEPGSLVRPQALTRIGHWKVQRRRRHRSRQHYQRRDRVQSLLEIRRLNAGELRRTHWCPPAQPPHFSSPAVPLPCILLPQFWGLPCGTEFEKTYYFGGAQEGWRTATARSKGKNKTKNINVTCVRVVRSHREICKTTLVDEAGVLGFHWPEIRFISVHFSKSHSRLFFWLFPHKIFKNARLNPTFCGRCSNMAACWWKRLKGNLIEAKSPMFFFLPCWLLRVRQDTVVEVWCRWRHREPEPVQWRKGSVDPEQGYVFFCDKGNFGHILDEAHTLGPIGPSGLVLA